MGVSWLRHRACPRALAAGTLALGLAFAGSQPASARNADDLLVVDCLLPGKIQRLGTGAKKAAVKFWYWNDTEPNYDYLMWCASADGVTFYCKNTSGSTNNKWKRTTLNLKNVPGYGKMLGDSSVWVAWIMTTDGNVSGFPYDGSFIDGVAITVTK